MNKPHEHAEVIKAWADGAEIEFRVISSDGWGDCYGKPEWNVAHEYRIKSELPQTRMTRDELHAVFFAVDDDFKPTLVRVANEVIRRAIQDGDVILPESKGE